MTSPNMQEARELLNYLADCPLEMEEKTLEEALSLAEARGRLAENEACAKVCDELAEQLKNANPLKRDKKKGFFEKMFPTWDGLAEDWLEFIGGTGKVFAKEIRSRQRSSNE